MGDWVEQGPPTGDAETGGSAQRPAAGKVVAATSVANPSIEVDEEAGGPASRGAKPDTAPASTSITGKSSNFKFSDPVLLDTSRILDKSGYVSSQVGLLVSKYTRIRNDLFVVSRSGLTPERETYAERVAAYLRQAKEEVEKEHPNLPVTASLLSGADRSLVWLYNQRILLQKCTRTIAVLRELNSASPTVQALVTNLLEAQKQVELHRESHSRASDDALRNALEDALSSMDDLDREDIVEEDLQVIRLRILSAYLVLALLLLLAAIPFTTTPIYVPGYDPHKFVGLPSSNLVIWPVWWYPAVPSLSLVIAALGLAATGAAGGIISGMLKVRDSRTTLTRYRSSLLNLRLKPLVGAVAALVVYTFLSWNVLKGLEVSSPGVIVLTAFLAGFSERYFLRLVGAAEGDSSYSRRRLMHSRDVMSHPPAGPHDSQPQA